MDLSQADPQYIMQKEKSPKDHTPAIVTSEGEKTLPQSESWTLSPSFRPSSSMKSSWSSKKATIEEK
jgi:hypothetical protein